MKIFCFVIFFLGVISSSPSYSNDQEIGNNCIGGPFSEIFSFTEIEVLINFKDYILDKSTQTPAHDELLMLIKYLGLNINKKGKMFLMNNPPPLIGEKLLLFIDLLIEKKAWDYKQVPSNKDLIIKRRILDKLLKRERSKPSNYAYSVTDIYQEIDYYYSKEVVSFNERVKYQNIFKDHIKWNENVFDAFDDFVSVDGIPDITPLDTTEIILNSLKISSKPQDETINSYIKILKHDFSLEQHSEYRIVDLAYIEQELPYLHDRFVIRKKWKELTGKTQLTVREQVKLDVIWKTHGIDKAINVLDMLSNNFSSINLKSVKDTKLGKELSISEKDLDNEKTGLDSKYFHENILDEYVKTLKKHKIERIDPSDKNAIPINPMFIAEATLGVAVGKFLDKTQRDFERAIARGDVNEADRLFRLNSLVSLLEAGNDVAGDLASGATAVGASGNPIVAAVGIAAGAGWTIYKAGQVLQQISKNKKKLNNLKNPPPPDRGRDISDRDIDDGIDIIGETDDDDFYGDDLDIIFA